MQNSMRKRILCGAMAFSIVCGTFLNGMGIPMYASGASTVAGEEQHSEGIEIEATEKETEKQLPLLDEIKEQLLKEEIVVATDITVVRGEKFDIEKDFRGITFTEKVKVKYKDSTSKDGKMFNINRTGNYKVIYEVQPVGQSPVYQIERRIIVKEKNDLTAKPNNEDTKNTGSGNATEESEVESEPEQNTQGESDSEIQDNLSESQTEETDSKTVDVVVRDFSEEAVKGKRVAEEIQERSVFLSVVPEVGARSSSVSLVMGERLPYPEAIGDYATYYFYANGKLAYCLQSQLAAPLDADYVAEVLDTNLDVQKVLYYGYGGPGDLTSTALAHLDDDTKYIYTHIAASYAYQGEVGLYGCTYEGLVSEGVLDYIDFLLGQDTPPLAALDLQPSHQDAYISGDMQKTDEFELIGDYRNYINVSVPQNVTYVSGGNTQTGGNVKIYGGTKFNFTAPKSVTGTWQSGDLSGQLGAQWKTLVLTTPDFTQDIAYVDFQTDTPNVVNFSVKWKSISKIELIKEDATTHNRLAGAVFGVYEDAACTKLITKMPATKSDGSSSVELQVANTTVYLKELTAPKGYKLRTQVDKVTLNDSGIVSHKVTNTEILGAITIKKVDSETNAFVSQGAGKLANALYGLYAAEDISHPDGTGIVYKKGSLVVNGAINDKGIYTFKDLHLGKYYIQEITAPEGYQKDTTKYAVDISSEGGVTKEVTVKDKVKKQAFSLIKIGSNSDGTEMVLLENAGFKVYLIDSLSKVKNGTIKADSNGQFRPEQFRNYNFEKEVTALDYSQNASGTPMKEFFTDSKGYARSQELAYGQYVVVESTVPSGHLPIDPFIVTIDEDSREPQTWRVFMDYKFEALLKVLKVDEKSKLPILRSGATFKIYDLGKKEYVKQVTTYPTVVVHSEFVTNEEGYLITPETLEAGKYRLEEIKAPDGYVKSESTLEFTISDNQAYQVEENTGAIVITMKFENKQQQGEVKLKKYGEKLCGYENETKLFKKVSSLLGFMKNNTNDFEFIYELGTVEGAKFNVYAKEDIYTPDFQLESNTQQRKMIYRKDDLVGAVVTDQEGNACLSNIPLGSYWIEEIEAGYGFTLSEEKKEFTITSQDDVKEIIYHDVEFVNERQKVEISIEKLDSRSKRPVKGASFGLYVAHDIQVGSEVLVPANSLICEAVSDENGIVKFDKDIPIGKYFVKELKAAPGYVTNSTPIEFDLEYTDQNLKVVSVSETMENEFTKVQFSKEDIGGKPVIGAELVLQDSERNEIAKWITDGTKHQIDCLEPGDYYLIETLAPAGYEIAEEVKFTVFETGEIQKVKMIDEFVKKGKISIFKIGDRLAGTTTHESKFGNITRMTFEKKPLSGVEFTIYNSKSEVVDILTTTDQGEAVSKDLDLGTYTVKETKTPSGLAENKKEYKVTLEKDKEKKVIDVSLTVENNVVDTEINVFKTGEVLNAQKGKFEYGKKALRGVYFGIYTNQSFKSGDKVVVSCYCQPKLTCF